MIVVRFPLRMKPLVILTTFLYFTVGNCDYSPDYYWKEYLGTVPEDAVVAGSDMAGNQVYIGQGYLLEIGIVPGRLINGSKTMIVGSGYKSHVTSFIKVLCGPQGKFYWLTANRDNLHLLLEGKHAVIGGYQSISSRIGRVNIDGKTMIGKIYMQPNGISNFHYADGGKEHEVASFQTLIYNGDRVWSIPPRKNPAAQ